MTPTQQEATRGQANGTVEAPPPLPLPERDVRRKRPPLLSFVLRLETLRRIARVASLLVLDFIGVAGAVYTSMMIKLALLGQFDLQLGWHDTKPWISFAYLVTVLMFARVDLYSDRPRRPGLGKIATALFQATVIEIGRAHV